jgi:hypothetical protein
MIAQETLFDTPMPTKPPSPPKLTIVPKILGKCIKCKKDATLASPSGNPDSIYCAQCGKCTRKVYGVMKGIAVLRMICSTSIEKFVRHPVSGIWCCPCYLDFEVEMRKKGRGF